MAEGVVTFINSNPFDWENNENASVHLPKGLRAAKHNNRWVKGDRETPGHYERVTLPPIEERQFPKTLYHPEYGLKPPPDPNDFKSPQEFRVAQRAYNMSNYPRTIIVESKRDEEKYLKIGWLPKPVEHAPTENRKAFGEL